MERTTKYTKGIIEQLIQDVEARHREQVRTGSMEVHPADLAEAMEDWNEERLELFCSMAEEEKIAEILEEAEEKLQKHMVKHLENDRMLVIFSYMEKDDIVDLLGNLKIGRRKQLVDLMQAGDRRIIQQLLGYEADTAGGIMTTGYVALSGKLSIGAALQKIKKIGPKTEWIETIFVLNHKKQLIGTVDLRNILITEDGESIESIMDDQVISIEPETDQEEVSLLVSKYDLGAIPVVNKRNMMLGIITVDDIIDVIMEEHTEDMLQMGGVSKEETIDSTLVESVRMRLPWLFVNLITAFVAALAVKLFEDVILQVVALSATMSIVTGMGGNAGSQTLSIMIRSIALGEVELKGCFKIVRKEILLGMLDGAATGAVTGLVVYLVYGSGYLGLIIFIAMIGNMFISGLFGALVPLVLKSLGADPALASSIFLTTATDTLGFFIFLGLAKVFLPFLI